MDISQENLIPPRRTYFDMNPWYEHLKKIGENEWQNDKNVELFLWSILKNQMRKKQIFKVLDVGCGGGRFALSLLQKNLEIDAFDFSEIAIDLAKEKPNSGLINFFVANALSEETYKMGFYNIIVAKDFLHGIFDQDRLVFLNLVKKALAPNGHLFLTTQIGLPLTQVEKLKTIDLKSRKNKIQTQVFLEKEQIESEFLKVGFEIRVFQQINESTGLYVLTQ